MLDFLRDVIDWPTVVDFLDVAWSTPTAIVIALVMFRRPITKLLQRTDKLDIFGVKMEGEVPSPEAQSKAFVPKEVAGPFSSIVETVTDAGPDTLAESIKDARGELDVLRNQLEELREDYEEKWNFERIWGAIYGSQLHFLRMLIDHDPDASSSSNLVNNAYMLHLLSSSRLSPAEGGPRVVLDSQLSYESWIEPLIDGALVRVIDGGLMLDERGGRFLAYVDGEHLGEDRPG